MGKRLFLSSKKLTASLLILCILMADIAGVLPGGYAGFSGLFTVKGGAETFGDYKYEVINKSEIEITGYNGSDTQIMIPGTIDDMIVTSIGYSAFSGCAGLTSIEIPSSVVSIGAFAFSGCTGLTSIEIPSSVESIGILAFAMAIKEFIVDDDNQYFSSEDGVLFSKNKDTLVYFPAGNQTLSSYTVPTSVTSIGVYAFAVCPSLTAVTIPDSVTSIGDSAFIQCEALADITIPGSVTSIGAGALDGTKWYEDQADGLVYAGSIAYKYKGEAPTETSVTLKDGTTVIADSAFSSCIWLTDIEIPSSVTSIGNNAFYNCTGLTGIEIPNSVISIGSGAFYNCTGLTDVEIPSGVSIINDSTFSGCTGLKSIIIPGSVTNISKYAFYDCSALTAVEIPNSVVSIGNSAFEGCSALKGIKIPNSVITIGDYAFYGCAQFTAITTDTNSDTTQGNVIIPSSVTTIGEYAFNKCVNIASISIPDSVINLGESVFFGTEWYKDQPDGMVYLGKVAYIYKPEVSLEGLDIELKNDTIAIAGGAFYDLQRLKSIVIPSSVKSIGCNAFYNCSGLKRVVLPEGIINIDNKAFENCYNLKSIEIPRSVISIGTGAYQDCTNLVIYGASNSFAETYAHDNDIPFSTGTPVIDPTLDSLDYAIINTNEIEIIRYNGKETTVEIPAEIDEYNVTSIGDSAFSGNTTIQKISIPNGVTDIGRFAFRNCTALADIEIPDSVTKVGTSAFDGTAWYSNRSVGVVYTGKVAYSYKGTMPENKSLTLADGTVATADNAFRDNDELISFTIPSSVISLGINTLSACDKLESVIIPSSVTTIGSGSFYSCPNLTLYGVSGSVAETFSSSIPFSTGNPSTFPDPDDIEYRSLGSSRYEVVKYKGTATEVTIPGRYNGYSVTSIGSDAFKNNTTLTKINFASNIANIENGAFDGSKWYDELPIGMIYIGKIAYKYKGAPQGTTVTIKDGTLSITNYAFKDCTGLTSVTIPNSVGSIGVGVFAGCTGLTSITIPDSVKSIESDAFADCTKLANITVPDSVTTVGYGAFRNTAWYNSQADGMVYVGTVAYRYKEAATGGEDVILKDGTVSIADYAFKNCTTIESVTIPSSVSNISDSAFVGCSGLLEFVVADDSQYFSAKDGVLFNKNQEFLRCYPAGKTNSTYTIPSNVYLISNNAFFGCSSLTEIKVAEGNKNFLSEYGVLFNSDRTTIICYPAGKTDETYDIMNKITNIRENAFYGSKLLTEINVDSDNKNYASEDGVLFNKNKTVLIYYPTGKTDAEYVVPDSVISINGNTFVGCTALESVTIPNTVTSIGDNSFIGCTNLVIYGETGSAAETYAYNNNILFNTGDPSTDTSGLTHKEINTGEVEITGYNGTVVTVTIPSIIDGKPVTSIGKDAFKDKTTLTEIIISSSVKIIDDNAFAGCTGMASVIIPNSVTSIADGVFTDCTNLTFYGVAGSCANDYANKNNIPFSTGKPSADPIPAGLAFKTIKGNEIEITNYNGTVTELAIPGKIENKTVTSIGADAFKNKTAPTVVVLPNSVTSIGAGAFIGCDKLTGIVIPSTVTNIGANAFDGCTNLIIYCEADSTAETYARENKIPLNIDSTLDPTNPKIVGDVNNDGLVTEADVIDFKHYLANWDVSIFITENADVHSDGKVDDIDVIVLKRLLEILPTL